ncbi:MAG: hypothetical protein N3G20_05775, partial [Verrucomicrobiae bacterium]|nr:hypothetical protein [Verrucomicrobiae bacterium]
AEPLALDTKVEFGSPSAPIVKGASVVTVPATISLRLKPGEPSAPPRSAYHRLLYLLWHLVEYPRRADIVGIEVYGNTNSVSHAVANINLWASETTM